MSDKYGVDQDPYCYPDTNTLINLFNIQDEAALERAERKLTELAIEKISFAEPPYDFAYVRNIPQEKDNLPLIHPLHAIMIDLSKQTGPPLVSAAETLDLTISERIQLVTEIWDSIAEFPEEIELTSSTRLTSLSLFACCTGKRRKFLTIKWANAHFLVCWR